MERRIIDKRRKEKYILDDEYLNGQARLCGWQGTIVYNSLCRHANINQECFPSIKMMMEQHNVSRNTILKGIENLEKRKVIEVKKARSKKGQWLNNTYILLDKSEWIYAQVPVKDTVDQVPVELTPSPCEGLDQVPVKDTKETHKQGNTFKETHIAAPEVAAPSNEQTKEDFIQKCRENKRRDINIIGAWAELTGVSFSKKDQWNLYVRRNVRAANQLSTFDDDQIQEAFSKVEEDKKNGLKYQPALETLLKKLTK